MRVFGIFFYAQTNRFLWFQKEAMAGKKVDINTIVGSSDNIFLFVPSDSLLNQFEDDLGEHRIAVEQTETKNPYILISTD